MLTKFIRYVPLLLIILLLAPAPLPAVEHEAVALPPGFVYVTDIAPEILLEIRYYGEHNFTGAPVKGYEAPVAILTLEAATALQAMSDDCRYMGYGVKIFDAYRPQSAVNHFLQWSRQPESGTTKTAFYPNLNKAQLFKQGYLATRSGHSRGSTVDLTLVELTSGEELDMGSPFDFLDPLSHFNAKDLTREQIYNRSLLRTLMETHGFRAYNKEWWHFTLKAEPFPNTYFDFPIRGQKP